MSSDINKEDEIDKFWSYLNGESPKNKNDQQSYTSNSVKDERTTRSFDNDFNKTIDMNANKRSTEETQNGKVEFDVTKMLKTFEDIEAFGSSDELEPIELNLSGSEEDESLSNDKRIAEETDIRNKYEKEEEVDRQTPPHREEESDSEQESMMTPVNLALSALLSGGLVMAVVLTFRLIYIMVGTVKNLLEYVVMFV
ncbi:uncharacterized protein LOC129000268 [Macrosteles quadrilineatus]|uniref:uncharacterized protein LOC129000268 n=1 Tax=Macrosteles quadrilineatus TaxID=74068 RepID=UPI0023E304B3|nr:uncharacterized protein LOC129000268 [Macrosteles quadrilineatus]